MQSANEGSKILENTFIRNLATFEVAARRVWGKGKECYWIMEERDPCYVMAEA